MIQGKTGEAEEEDGLFLFLFLFLPRVVGTTVEEDG